MERKLVLIALFAALTAALGLVPKIDLASGVPITAQSLGIMLCGTILGKRDGALAVLLFLVLALIGLPVLAGGRGGIGVFVGPTVGFLIGFPFAAFVAGWVVEKWRVAIGIAAFGGAIIGGIIVLYVFGIAGLMMMTGMSLGASIVAMAPFIIGDVIKAVLAGLITHALYQMRPEIVLSRS